MSNLEIIKAEYTRLLEETDFDNTNSCLDLLAQAFNLFTEKPGLPENMRRPVVNALLKAYAADKPAFYKVIDVLEGFKE